MAINSTDVDLGVVLVIGGSGFIGRHCLRHVLQNGGSQVQLHTMNSRIPALDKQLPGAIYHGTSLVDAVSVERTIGEIEPQVIIHIASPKPFIEPKEVYDAVNINGMRNVLAACDKVGTVKALVFCSSFSVIDTGRGNMRNVDESWPLQIGSEQKVHYFRSKAIAERLVLAHNRSGNPSGMLTTALRITSVFGEEDDQIIGGMISRAKTGELNTQIGDGENLMDWTYVGTVAAAHTHAAKRLLQAYEASSIAPSKSRVDGEAFFVSDAEPRPFWDVARQVAAEAGYPVLAKDIKRLPAFMAFWIGLVAEWLVFIISLGRRKSDVNRQQMRYCVIDHYCSTEKARQQLGFVPEVGIDEAVRRSVKWYKQERERGDDKTAKMK